MKFAILLALALTALEAQTIEVRSLYQQTPPLEGDWKTFTGDDPRFAAPDFDDSAWSTVRVPGQSLRMPLGISWIRFRVQLPETATAEPLKLLLPPLGASYDLFINGRQVGSFGDPRAAHGWGEYGPTAAAFAIPSGLRQLTIAVRTPESDLGGTADRPYRPGVGDANTEAC